MEGAAMLPASEEPPGLLLGAFTGLERIQGILPFVADLSTTPRWHHLLFTEDKLLAVPVLLDPPPESTGLLLAPPTPFTDRYPSVRDALRLVAIPRPLLPHHVSAVVPYAVVRRARLSRGRDSRTLPELEVRAGHLTTWWFFRKDDEIADEEKACYARDLLLSLLPFPVELVGFSVGPRPPEWRLRRGAREPLPLLPMLENGEEGPSGARRFSPDALQKPRPPDPRRVRRAMPEATFRSS